FGPGMGIELCGSAGMLHYDLATDCIRAAGKTREPADVPIPKEKEGGWRVEAEFVDAIRTGSPVRFTDFATGVPYMEFTEAVALSAERGEPVDLPLDDDDT